MDRKTLTLAAAIAGGLMMLALVMLPFQWADGGDKNVTFRAAHLPAGAAMLVAAWIAGAFAMAVTFRERFDIGVPDRPCRVISLLAFKLVGFLCLAVLFSGTPMGLPSKGGTTIGFWLTFIAAIAGAFAMYLTFNPTLGKTIAKQAESLGMGTIPVVEEDDAKSTDAQAAKDPKTGEGQ